MIALETAFNMHHGTSLYGSQGNQDGSRVYVNILQRIHELGEKKLSSSEKAKIIIDIAKMLDSWCGIETLGIRSIAEEFRARFEESCSGKGREPEKVPKLSISLPVTLRIIPLYAPARDNYLQWFKKTDGAENNDGEYEYRLLYIDTAGKIVCFTAKQAVEKHTILYEHEVSIAHATEDELAGYLGRSHLMFDYCMRELIGLCMAAVTRAEERAAEGRKSIFALMTIAEEMRKDNLTLAILLSEENFRGMSGCELNRNIFRKIVEQAGATPEARLEELERQRVILDRKSLTEVSSLTMNETMQIVNEWKIEKPAATPAG